MEEQMGKRLIRAAVVLFLLLLVEIGAGQDLKRGMIEEYGETDPPVKPEGSEESGQEDEILLQEEPEQEGGEIGESIGGIEQYYGTYRIAEFWGSRSYRYMQFDCLPKQEADMLLGRIVEIGEEQMVTYDSFRWIGSREGGYLFFGNYLIEEISIPHPQYEWEALDPDTKWYEEVGNIELRESKSSEYFEKIEGRITIQVEESGYKHEYYVMRDGIIMYSGITGQFFYLEKADAEHDGTMLQNELTDEDAERILQELYGTYTVKRFLPTKFYPAPDSDGDIRLPQEEADMMIGKEIIVEKDLFVTYDNYRLPNSWSAGRAMDDFFLEAAEIENPDYQIKIQSRDEIYGLRDEMLPEELVQDTYIRINVFPGYSRMDWNETLPQLYMLDDGRMIMYAMGEYFLIEREG